MHSYQPHYHCHHSCLQNPNINGLVLAEKRKCIFYKLIFIKSNKLHLNFHGERGRRKLRRQQVVRRRNQEVIKLTSETNWVPLPYILHLMHSMIVADVKDFLPGSNILNLFARLSLGKIWCYLPPVKLSPVKPSRNWETGQQSKFTDCFLVTS